MHRLIPLLPLVAALGCASRSAQDTTQQAGFPSQGDAMARVPERNVGSVEFEDVPCCQACPTALEDTHVEFGHEPGGAAMTFTTEAEEAVQELRERVAILAKYHNDPIPRLAMMTVPHRANVAAVDDGAKIILIASAKNDADRLRLEVQNQVEMMQSGHCPPVGAHEDCSACARELKAGALKDDAAQEERRR